jgi:predicted permease
VSGAYLLVLVMLLCGWLGARLRAFPAGAADTMNQFVIAVCLPAMILKLIPEIHFRRELLLLAVTPWLLLPVAVALIVALARLFAWPRTVRGALLLCVPLGNTSFLGFPMVDALLGRQAVGLAVVYDQLGSFFILATYGLFVLGAHGGSR